MTDFAATRRLFQIPDDVVYLDGNSLGPLPRATPDRLARTLDEEWAQQLIRAWNTSDWIGQPMLLGDRIGRLLNAPIGHVVVGDTLSIKVHQALAAALEASSRRIILTDHGNFPSDVYVAEGLAATLGRGHEVRRVAPDGIEAALDDEVAVLLLTHVDYRTGRMHDMAALTRRAHEVGALCVWDLAHSAGAVPVDLLAADVDFAVGCTYKYLNGGPGAPAFLYAAPRRADSVTPAIPGWLGHAAPFAFEASYRPARGVERFRIGTPAVLQMAALEASLDIWDEVDIHRVHEESVRLAEKLIAGLELRCGRELTLASPRDAMQRGSHVSFHHPEGYAVVQACIEHGVIGDFRAPDILRFGIAPLYIGDPQIERAIDVVAQVLEERLWDDERYRVRRVVT
ncbi:MAG: kynureninase [Planctomycetota bacterium]|nr:kynureninase [Planctomycetota bacterium]